MRTHDFWKDFLCPNGGCEKQTQAFRLVRVAKTRGFNVSRKGIENDKQHGSKNDSIVELWAPMGRIFDLLEGSLRGFSCEECLISNKSIKSQKIEKEMKKERLCRKGRRVGWGSPRKSQQDLQKRSQTPCPCKQGVVDLKCCALPADPRYRSMKYDT